jgi:hypothetical protein
MAHPLSTRTPETPFKVKSLDGKLEIFGEKVLIPDNRSSIGGYPRRKEEVKKFRIKQGEKRATH